MAILTSCAPQENNENKIVIWHWLNDRKDALAELASKYQTETGIEVEFKLFSPPDIYAQKVIAAARAGNLPDIFGILSEKKVLASFIKAGHILDLTSEMKQDGSTWKKKFYPQALNVTSFGKNDPYDVKPGIYAVPIDITVMEFLYNRTLFKKAGLDPDLPPETFQDFIDYAKTIKKSLGIDGFICGWGEGWLLNALAVEWAINLMGEDKFFKTLEGDVPYTDRQWIEVFSLFAKMKESGILGSNITTMVNKEAEDAFSKSKAGFTFNGSWAINVYYQLDPNLDYAFFPLPKVSKSSVAKIWGGAGSSFMVNAKSKNSKKAVDFLRWITDNQQQQFLAKETNNLPSIRNSEEGLSDTLTSLVDDLDNLTHPNVWPYNEDSRVLEVMNKGLQQIFMGIKTPEQVAKAIQEVKSRVLSND